MRLVTVSLLEPWLHLYESPSLAISILDLDDEVHKLSGKARGNSELPTS